MSRSPPSGSEPGQRVATSDFDYDLPPERIARYPAGRRSDARLLVLSRSSGRVRHMRFRDLPALMDARDLLVVNDTRVFPARLRGRKPTGAAAEVLLLRPAGWDDDHVWEALVRPGRKLKPGRQVVVGPELRVHVMDVCADGRRIVRLDTPLEIREAIERFGRVPLPPYLEREAEPLDRERYQTVYSRREGSVAAPTAGLHFTPELLADLEAGGVRTTALTLHVGTATFRPVEVDDPSRHTMDAEWFDVPESAVRAYHGCRRRGGRVWAVGTTVVRTLESVAEGRRGLRAGSGTPDLFIHPPYDFRAVDCLITNFHLPRSTLLMLVAAFAGPDRVRAAYDGAVAARYRFYSYGDAMAVVP